MRGLHIPAGDWMVMAHGRASLQYTDVSGPRGDDKVYATSMLMLSGERRTDWGRIQLKSMMSLEPAMEARGYPNLFATGETAGGLPLVDRQHPHDLFMELAARVDFNLGKDTTLFLYGGPVGEPALGPVAAPHRESAAADPFAPLGHHWMDSTHVTFGVVTAGLFTRQFKLEASWFNGREPDSNRSNFDFRRMDSYSTRLSYNPTRDLSLQVSWGYLKSPEQLEPDVSINRITSSATYNRPLASGGNWATTAGWGRNIPSTGKPTDALLLESNFDLDRVNVFFGRAEYVRKSGEDLDVSPSGQTFNVGAISLGYLRNFQVWNAFIVSPGVMVTTSFIDGRLEDVYHSQTPVGVAAFIRFRPALMKMD